MESRVGSSAGGELVNHGNSLCFQSEIDDSGPGDRSYEKASVYNALRGWVNQPDTPHVPLTHDPMQSPRGPAVEHLRFCPSAGFPE
jgi:hypothetical protein